MSASENTSYQLRRKLRKIGWEFEELDDRVLLIKPTEDGDTSFADSLFDEEIEARGSSLDEQIEEAEEIKFGLERDLQAALRANITQLESGLSIIDDNKERYTDAGKVDITAQDKQGNIVVIELKAGMAMPEAVTQILAYMGAVEEVENKPIRGLLVANDFHKKVILAAKAVPSLELKKYSFQFKFEPVK
jgi:RecB family endonuclease NucS